jgi:hypothetical protein
MKNSKYIATVGGHSMRAVDYPVATITAGRRAAEDYGTTADWCTIKTRAGKIVASHVRSNEGNGQSWYKTTV